MFQQSVRGQLAALSLGLLCSSAVWGQSISKVTIYGIADAGIEVNDSGEPGAGRVTKLNTGNQSSNRLGFLGKEDLGGGYAATFNLELGYALDTGELLTLAVTNGLFSRRAVVGLATPFGIVELGRDYTPGYWTVNRNDRFKYGLPGTISAASQLNEGRTNNGIFYQTPTFAGGFYGRLAYGFGRENTVEPRNLGRFAGGSVEYKTGGLFASVSYQERKDLVPGSTTSIGTYKEGGAGFNYEFKPFALNAGYFATNPLDGAADSIAKTRAYWAGAAYNLTPTSIVYAQVANTQFDFVGPRGSGSGLTYGIAYNYFLSKRVNLYAAYGGVNNDNARQRLSTGSQNVGGVVFGASPKAFVTGIRHSF